MKCHGCEKDVVGPPYDYLGNYFCSKGCAENFYDVLGDQ